MVLKRERGRGGEEETGERGGAWGERRSLRRRRGRSLRRRRGAEHPHLEGALGDAVQLVVGQDQVPQVDQSLEVGVVQRR